MNPRRLPASLCDRFAAITGAFQHKFTLHPNCRLRQDDRTCFAQKCEDFLNFSVGFCWDCASDTCHLHDRMEWCCCQAISTPAGHQLFSGVRFWVFHDTSQQDRRRRGDHCPGGVGQRREPLRPSTPATVGLGASRAGLAWQVVEGGVGGGLSICARGVRRAV